MKLPRRGAAAQLCAVSDPSGDVSKHLPDGCVLESSILISQHAADNMLQHRHS